MGLLSNGSFETWTTDGNPGNTNGTLPNWTIDSVNGGTATKGLDAPNGEGSYCLNIRSGGATGTDSVGAVISDSFALTFDYLYFWHKSENANVTFTVELYDADSSGEPLLNSYTPTIVTSWTLQRIDVSAYKGGNVKVRLSQHTNIATFGYYTYIDYVQDIDNAGTFQNGGFENWIDSASPDHWEKYSVNNGIAEQVADPNSGTYGAKIRSSVSAPVDSIGGFKSHPFYLENSTLKWYQKSQNADVVVTVRLFDRDGTELDSTTPSISVGSYTQQSWDISAYANQDVMVQFEQHTASAGLGYYTHIDDVTLEGSVPLGATLNDTLTLADEIQLNLSQEKANLGDTVSLSDEIDFTSTQETNQGDSIDIGDEIDISLAKTVEDEDTLTLSDEFEFYIEQRKNILNDIRTSKQVLKNILNKVNTSFQVFENISNLFGMVKGKLYNIVNDIRSLRQETTNITNDFRMLLPFQAPGDAGFQALGKTYIRVYISSSEQTDVNIDSIDISKALNGAHQASFVLSRPYDDTKPAEEAEIEIKYNTWTLYKGYITSISPTDSPDSIKINCLGKYWKENRTNKYFFVGHKPKDNKELYYSSPYNALIDQFGINFGIGLFVPQTINCFGQGSSDCITSLITDCGNFGWYYDVNGSAKLWTAGQGDIVTLDRQEIGKNLELHQVLSHNFSESVEGLVNQYRVQMGDKIVRRFTSIEESANEILNSDITKEYIGYAYLKFTAYAEPGWKSSYETLTPPNGTGVDGYGLNSLPPTSDVRRAFFDDVYTRYKLPDLDSDLESWSDRFTPAVFIEQPDQGWEITVPIYEELKRDGFTIDYENKLLKFNDKVYLYKKDDKGNVVAHRAPIIKLILWKKKHYSNTESDTENTESLGTYPTPNDQENVEDLVYPLVFLTGKMGDYPITITDSLELSGLSVQVGGWYTSGRTETGKKIRTHVPSWNDRPFAYDLANWKLSKVADKKIVGEITVTLDTVCHYDINLSKRIYIEGITEQPLNIESIDYNLADFTCNIRLASHRYYLRQVSLPSHGE